VAGALSDQLQAQKDEKGEEATLASQEHVQIRGNDARHLLIQKLVILFTIIIQYGSKKKLNDGKDDQLFQCQIGLAKGIPPLILLI
jgi:hypothetical protein